VVVGRFANRPYTVVRAGHHAGMAKPGMPLYGLSSHLHPIARITFCAHIILCGGPLPEFAGTLPW
jgi:hypothetical protein